MMNVEVNIKLKIFGRKFNFNKSILSELLIALMAIQGGAGLAIITIIVSIKENSIHALYQYMIPGLLHLLVLFFEGFIVFYLSSSTQTKMKKCMEILFNFSLVFNILAFISFLFFIYWVRPLKIPFF